MPSRRTLKPQPPHQIPRGLSHLTEDRPCELIRPARPLAFTSDRDTRASLAQYVQRQFPQRSEVFGSMILAVARPVLVIIACPADGVGDLGAAWRHQGPDSRSPRVRGRAVSDGAMGAEQLAPPASDMGARLGQGFACGVRTPICVGTTRTERAHRTSEDGGRQPRQIGTYECACA